MTLHRFVLPSTSSATVCLALFGFMYSLIYMDEPTLVAEPTQNVIRFADVREDTPPMPIVVKPKRPDPVKPTPKIVKIDEPFESASPDISIIPIYEPIPDKQTISTSDGQLVLVFGVPPEYPLREAQRGREGYVVVEFSVAPSGTVYDAFVIESNPKGAFEKAALKAIARFKYKPRIIGGKAVSTSGQQYQFSFEMDKT